MPCDRTSWGGSPFEMQQREALRSAVCMACDDFDGDRANVDRVARDFPELPPMRAAYQGARAAREREAFFEELRDMLRRGDRLRLLCHCHPCECHTWGVAVRLLESVGMRDDAERLRRGLGHTWRTHSTCGSHARCCARSGAEPQGLPAGRLPLPHQWLQQQAAAAPPATATIW